MDDQIKSVAASTLKILTCHKGFTVDKLLYAATVENKVVLAALKYMVDVGALEPFTSWTEELQLTSAGRSAGETLVEQNLYEVLTNIFGPDVTIHHIKAEDLHEKTPSIIDKMMNTPFNRN